MKRIQLKSTSKPYNPIDYNDPLSYMNHSNKRVFSLHNVKSIAIHTACNDGFYSIIYNIMLKNSIVYVSNVEYYTNRPNKIIKIKGTLKKFKFMGITELLNRYKRDFSVVVCTNDIQKPECIGISNLQKLGYSPNRAQEVENLIAIRKIKSNITKIDDQESFVKGLMLLCKQKNLILILERNFIKVKNTTSIDMDSFPNFKKILDEKEQYNQHYDLYKFIQQKTNFTLGTIIH